MENKIAKALKLEYEPVAILKTAVQFEEGKWRCVMRMLARLMRGEAMDLDAKSNIKRRLGDDVPVEGVAGSTLFSTMIRLPLINSLIIAVFLSGEGHLRKMKGVRA